MSPKKTIISVQAASFFTSLAFCLSMPPRGMTAEPVQSDAVAAASLQGSDVTCAFLSRVLTARGYQVFSETKRDFWIRSADKSFVSNVIPEMTQPRTITFRSYYDIKQDRPLEKKLQFANRLNERKRLGNFRINTKGHQLVGSYSYVIGERVDLDQMLATLTLFRDCFLAARDNEMDLDGLIGDKIYGVGIVFAPDGKHTDYVLISTVASNSPASAAGIQAGSKLTAIDGKSLKGATVEVIAAMLYNDSSPAVKLTVQGPGDAQPIEMSLRKIWLFDE